MSWDNTHYREFATSLEAAIASYGETGEEHYDRQKRQVDTLIRLEREFRDELIGSEIGVEVYSRFIAFVRDEKRNILSARPYFRERQDRFRDEIAPALRERSLTDLYKFNINYPFVALALKPYQFQFDQLRLLGQPSKLEELANQIKAARRELIEMNIPLAISRARAFDRYRQRHLEYMDLVQIATEGLMAAIDKFVLPYGKNYGAVLYGRITGDLTEGNSETMVHFYPTDKRRLYAANKFVREGKTFEEIAEKLRIEAGDSIDAYDLQQIHTAAVTVSGDSSGPSEESHDMGESGDEPISRFEADPSCRPDVQFEQAELTRVLRQEISALSVFERKLLALKGISL